MTAWVRAGRLLAFAAALALLLGLHPPHAEAAGGASDHGAASDHSHFSAACVKGDLEQASHAKPGGTPSGHVDCTVLFHPLLRVAAQETPAFGKAAVPLPPAERARHRVFTADPPPPRATA